MKPISTRGCLPIPVLMAADILLYQSNLVPVGSDQKQHLELDTRYRHPLSIISTAMCSLCRKPHIGKIGSRVMSLQEPTSKMSKSDSEDTYISMLDTPDDIRRKIKRAVTDSDAEIRFDPETKPGVSNLLSIAAALSGQSIESVTQEPGRQGVRGFEENRDRDCDWGHDARSRQSLTG